MERGVWKAAFVLVLSLGGGALLLMAMVWIAGEIAAR